MTHTMHRVELIIERMAYQRAGRIFEAAGLRGYTVLPAMAGFGNGTGWQRETDISGSRDMVVMIAIAEPARVAESLKEIARLLDAHIGVVSVSEVEVLRPERF